MRTEAENRKEDEKLIQFLKSEGYYEIRNIDGQGLCGLRKFAFTTGLIIGIEQLTYLGRYCFPSERDALNALNDWNGMGDPSGNWIKYKGFGGDRENQACKNCKL